MKIRSKCRLVLFRFNMVEVALALVVLAIGLSSVMVLFPVGLKASQSGVADNNLGDVAERVAAYLQAKCSSSEVWKGDGTFKELSIGVFDPDPADSSSPTSDEFSVGDGSAVDGMKGLFQLTKNSQTYYLYQQYSPVGSSGNDRAVDFEAIVRVGWDNATLGSQYYPKPIKINDDCDDFEWDKLSSYLRPTPASGVTDPGSGRMGGSGADILDQCCRALIIEISWPADVVWSKREKRIFRVEMFNENFVPYPQTP